MPSPPSDLDRAERKQFRRTAQTLARQGVAVLARAEILADYVRAGTRLAELRRQEKEADPDRKMAAARAANVAAAEKRRLHDQLWRGVAMQRPRPSVAEQVAERALEIASNRNREAWRDYYHNRAHRDLSEDEMEAKYGRGDIATILYETPEAEAHDLIFFEACRSGRHRPPRYEDFEVEGEEDE